MTETQFQLGQMVGLRADASRQGPIIEVLPPTGGLQPYRVFHSPTDIWVYDQNQLVAIADTPVSGDLARAIGRDQWLDSEVFQVGRCTGRRPYLRDYEDRECDQEARPILLGASNSWFPIILTALSVPTDVDKLGQLVTEHWPVLGMVKSPEMVPLVRALGKIHAFVRYSDEEIWQAIERKRAGEDDQEEEHEDLRGPEWDVLISADPARNTADFKLRPVAPPEGFENLIEQVVLVERVREVNALVGFTRIESPGDFSEFADIPEERRAPLSRRSPAWVPASEVRGEGIFLHFSEAAIQRWMFQVPSLLRAREFRDAHGHWRRMRELPDTDESFPGLRYILLHSFSHALMRQLALECGYTSASIRERLYARDRDRDQDPMAGILLYTAAPDSEGTLGGLVRLGEPDQLRRHLAQALERLQLCASDPLCAEHKPVDGGTSVHGAACHACLFVPETSCERGNRYLDRAVLAPTFADGGIAFFPSALSG